MAAETPVDCFLAQRRDMVEAQLRARGIRDERVLAAMSRVPRQEFIPAEYRDQAYEDHPIPIGEGQTVSQPYIVAIMLQALALDPSDTVLEIGTGSGLSNRITGGTYSSGLLSGTAFVSGSDRGGYARPSWLQQCTGVDWRWQQRPA